MLISIIHRVNRARGLNLDPLPQNSLELAKMLVGKGAPGRGMLDGTAGPRRGGEQGGEQGPLPQLPASFSLQLAMESLWLLAGRTLRRRNPLPREH